MYKLLSYRYAHCTIAEAYAVWDRNALLARRRFIGRGFVRSRLTTGKLDLQRLVASVSRLNFFSLGLF